MISYQVQRRFFIDKASADAHRKSLKLKPEALLKHSIQFRDELANLDAQIKQQATRTPANDTVGQQVLQDMIAQQIALRNLIQLQIRPAYTQQLGQLRQTVDTYNVQCTARPRYVLDVEKAQQNLVCPKP